MLRASCFVRVAPRTIPLNFGLPYLPPCRLGMGSGQNVEDIIKYSTLDGSLDILERLLEWRHLAPTAPGLPFIFIVDPIF